MCVNSNSPLSDRMPCLPQRVGSKSDHDLCGETHCHVTLLNNKKQHVNDPAFSSIKEVKAK